MKYRLNQNDELFLCKIENLLLREYKSELRLSWDTSSILIYSKDYESLLQLHYYVRGDYGMLATYMECYPELHYPAIIPCFYYSLKDDVDFIRTCSLPYVDVSMCNDSNI